MYRIVTSREVYDDDFAESVVRIGPDQDDLGLVQLSSPGTDQKITIPLGAIHRFIDALNECAREIAESQDLVWPPEEGSKADSSE